MLLADLVAASAAVASTRSRTAKITALADLLAAMEPDEIEPAVAALSGAPRQGKVGVGWANAAIEGTATEPSLTIGDLHVALDELAVTAGSGSVARRRELLDDLAARATPDEADFFRRLLLGELRQGALAGVVADGVAKAAGVPATTVRRAAMLTGDLPATARLALVDGADALDAVGLRVGVAVQPMLASTAGDVGEALAATGAASVEWKLDGARVQAHRDGDEVRLFTRNLNDITDRMPGLVQVLLAVPVRSFILDGEALGVSEDGLPDGLPGLDQQLQPPQRRRAGGARRDVVRPPAPRRRRPHRSAAVGATRHPRVDARHRPHPGRPHRRRRGRAAHARRRAGGGPRGSDGEGAVVARTRPVGVARSGAR